VLKDGRRGDLVQVFNVDTCIPNPLVLIQFPRRISLQRIRAQPALKASPGMAARCSASTATRNDGRRPHIFNMTTYQPDLSINPIRDVCCYRDPQWSPDGTHLLFAFQDYLQGSSSTTQLYYIPYGSIGTGAAYEPLPLPEITDPKEKPQPVLRPR
jgi:hypothetical protein